MEMTPVIALHLAGAIIALALGAIVLARPKGTAAHKAMGRVWVGLMVVVAVSSFWIQGLNQGTLSPIHVLSAWTLFALGVAIYSIRRGRIRNHRLWMIGTYVGLIGAGLGALAPGRLLSRALGG